MFEASCAVTVKLNDVPLVATAGAETTKCVAGPAFTVMLLEFPVIEAITVSVAVIVRKPAVLSIAGKVPTPFVSTAFAGSVAAPSLLVKCTVPV